MKNVKIRGKKSLVLLINANMQVHKLALYSQLSEGFNKEKHFNEHSPFRGGGSPDQVNSACFFQGSFLNFTRKKTRVHLKGLGSSH